MKHSRANPRQVWLIAAITSVTLVGGTAALVRVPVSPASTERIPPARSMLAFAEANQEQADLYDPTPLFLPTPWNARPPSLAAGTAREPGGWNRDYAPQPTYTEDSARPVFPPPVDVPATPADALAIGTPRVPFAGMGRVDREIPKLNARHAFVEILAASSGQIVLTKVLTDARPPTDSDWQPMEFLVTAAPAGLIGSPRLATSSGVEQVDRYFQDYLVKTLHIGARLAPGFYRIKIGP